MTTKDGNVPYSTQNTYSVDKHNISWHLWHWVTIKFLCFRCTQMTLNCTYLSSLTKAQPNKASRFLKHVTSTYVGGCCKRDWSYRWWQNWIAAVFGIPNQISQLNLRELQSGTLLLSLLRVQKILEYIFYTNLNMERHITGVLKSTFYMIYNIRRIRKYLDQESAKRIVHTVLCHY